MLEMVMTMQEDWLGSANCSRQVAVCRAWLHCCRSVELEWSEMTVAGGPWVRRTTPGTGRGLCAVGTPADTACRARGTAASGALWIWWGDAWNLRGENLPGWQGGCTSSDPYRSRIVPPCRNTRGARDCDGRCFSIWAAPSERTGRTARSRRKCLANTVSSRGSSIWPAQSSRCKRRQVWGLRRRLHRC